jgi:hypothetical protein
LAGELLAQLLQCPRHRVQVIATAFVVRHDPVLPMFVPDDRPQFSSGRRNRHRAKFVANVPSAEA